jgi:hypothetical protein
VDTAVVAMNTAPLATGEPIFRFYDNRQKYSHCSRVTAALAAWFLHDQDPIRTSASLTVDRGSMSHDAACEGSVN